MNLDRPLDELVKESLATKRAERKAARQKRAPARKKNINPTAKIPANASDDKQPANGNANPANSNMDIDTRQDRLNPRRRGAGIGKKRRQRKQSLGGMEINTARKPAPAVGQGNQGNIVTGYPREKAVKVVVSNLHPQVSQTDIAELFETVGPLKSATLTRYPNGASACEAEVMFENMPDALEAIKRYNMVPLDNQPLKITLVTTKTQQKSRRAPQKKAAMDLDDNYRSPEGEKGNGFDDRSPERGPQSRRRANRRRRPNRPDDRRQDDRRPNDRRPNDLRQDDRRQDDRRQDDRRPDDRRDDRQDRDRDMYAD